MVLAKTDLIHILIIFKRANSSLDYRIFFLRVIFIDGLFDFFDLLKLWKFKRLIILSNVISLELVVDVNGKMLFELLRLEVLVLVVLWLVFFSAWFCLISASNEKLVENLEQLLNFIHALEKLLLILHLLKILGLVFYAASLKECFPDVGVIFWFFSGGVVRFS